MPRNVLLIADAFYPLTLAGAHRPSKLAKFLPSFGWCPIVLCPEWTEANAAGFLDRDLDRDVASVDVHRVTSPGLSSASFDRARRKAESLLWPYAAPITVVGAMVRRALRLIRERNVEVLWSTYNPGYPHVVASLLARRTGVPWVADFRDLPDQAYQGLTERRLALAERLVCAPASALSVTTPVLRDKLLTRHRKPVVVIENGYDPEDFPAVADEPSVYFTISYFGILYAYRDPRPVFEALDHLASQGDIDLERVRVRFFGTSPDQLAPLVQPYACKRVVRAERRLGKDALVREQRRSTVLLNLQSAEAGGAVPSKLMEYLGARRPILNVPGDAGPIDAVLADTGAGATARSAAEIAAVLRDWYKTWSRTGGLDVGCMEDRLQRYTRRDQAGRFADLFSRVTANRGAS